MPSALQVISDIVTEGGLHLQLLSLGPDPWGFDCFLKRHSMIDQVHQSLQNTGEDPDAARGT